MFRASASLRRSAGLVGLPNVGKSTLFNSLVRAQLAAASNFPFTTIKRASWLAAQLVAAASTDPPLPLHACPLPPLQHPPPPRPAAQPTLPTR